MKKSKSICTWLAVGVVSLSSFAGGMLVPRILYEWLFPTASWLGQPGPSLIFALGTVLVGLVLWSLLASHLSGNGWSFQFRSADGQEPIACPTTWKAVIPFLPWLAGYLYLTSSPVNLVGGRLLFFGCLWLSFVFVAWILAKPGAWKWLGPLFLLLVVFPIYLLTLGRTVGTADTFEFQVVVPSQGIVHPTGYPLYLLLTKVFTYIPANSVAWRVNLATAFYGLAAVCVLYWLLWRLQNRPIPALLAALIFGLAPTFWSQAVQAEVYTLHALIVVTALLLMREIGDWTLAAMDQESDQLNIQPDESSHHQESGEQPGFFQRVRGFVRHPFGQTVLLAFVLGLGLANHLTTVILLPAAVLTVVFSYHRGRFDGAQHQSVRAAVLILAAFGIPLLLYAYLPIRWQAVNGEAMGFSRFIDWVIGGRFQGALQLSAWLDDSARYEVIGRLFEFDWQPLWLLVFSLMGAVWLFVRIWQYGLLLFITWLGYVFYALNYYVPDLAVFLIPAFLITALWWGVGLDALIGWLGKFGAQTTSSSSLTGEDRSTLGLAAAGLIAVVILAVLVIGVSERWSSVDASGDDGRTSWGRATLSESIEEGAAILADSDKFPPLYFLQQVDDIRPDLEIILLPDEQAYRSELDQRLSVGQDVYLARYLPGLEGTYHLGSQGPLTRVGTQAESELPSDLTPSNISFDSIQLVGYSLDRVSPYDDNEVAVTLYWKTSQPVDEVLQVYLRLSGEDSSEAAKVGHPANNYYPTNAWEPGEIVADFHSLTVPPGEQTSNLLLEVALAPPFTHREDLNWESVTSFDREPAMPSGLQPLRIQAGPNFLEGVVLPDRLRPTEEFSIVVTGSGVDHHGLLFELQESGLDAVDVTNSESIVSEDSTGSSESFIHTERMLAPEEPDLYDVLVSYPGEKSRCGWLSPRASSCSVGQIEVSGVPLPGDAHNFEDQIALTAIDLPSKELIPGSLFSLNLQWLAMAEMAHDYTVFVQILDSQDHIVGQVDSWPLQGTYPTSQWRPGEIINDPYKVRLDPDLSSGSYEIHVGLYMLETLQRMSVVDENGAALDDKVIIPGLIVP